MALSTLARDMETTTPWQQRRVEAMGRLRHLKLASYRQNSDGLFSPVETFIGLPFPRHTRALESVAALSVALFRVRVRHGPPQTLRIQFLGFQHLSCLSHTFDVFTASRCVPRGMAQQKKCALKPSSFAAYVIAAWWMVDLGGCANGSRTDKRQAVSTQYQQVFEIGLRSGRAWIFARFSEPFLILGSIMKVHDVFDDGKSVYFVMDRMHHDLLDGLLAEGSTVQGFNLFNPCVGCIKVSFLSEEY